MNPFCFSQIYSLLGYAPFLFSFFSQSLFFFFLYFLKKLIQIFIQCRTLKLHGLPYTNSSRKPIVCKIPASIWASLPLPLKTFDFVYNLIRILYLYCIIHFCILLLYLWLMAKIYKRMNERNELTTDIFKIIFFRFYGAIRRHGENVPF